MKRRISLSVDVLAWCYVAVFGVCMWAVTHGGGADPYTLHISGGAL